jgi:broad specificity phosphatase PhoE
MSLIIKLVRHGESEANQGKVQTHEVGDHTIALSERGWDQAREAGRRIGAGFLRGALIYTSPYRRTRQTLAGLIEGSGLAEDERGALRVYEDPRLREVEHGYEPPTEQQHLRRRHGWFYYRFRGGESPADCYDRTSSFLESMMRQVERKQAERVLIVTHGLTLRCFVMRYLHLSVEDFDDMDSPENCCVVTLCSPPEPGCAFRSSRWGASGLPRRT